MALDQVRIGSKPVGTYLHTLKRAFEEGQSGITVSAWGANNIAKGIASVEILNKAYQPVNFEGQVVLSEEKGEKGSFHTTKLLALVSKNGEATPEMKKNAQERSSAPRPRPPA